MKCRLILLLLLLILVSCRTAKHGGNTARPSERKEISRYEKILGIPLPPDADKIYISAISEWMGVPYKYGGNTRSGTDCSGLVQSIYSKVYNMSVDHNSAALFKKARSIEKNRLKDGDLVFFKINGDKISHVGLHVSESYFIHASTKKGVVISSLNEPYYKSAFAGYGTFR